MLCVSNVLSRHNVLSCLLIWPRQSTQTGGTIVTLCMTRAIRTMLWLSWDFQLSHLLSFLMFCPRVCSFLQTWFLFSLSLSLCLAFIIRRWVLDLFMHGSSMLLTFRKGFCVFFHHTPNHGVTHPAQCILLRPRLHGSTQTCGSVALLREGCPWAEPGPASQHGDKLSYGYLSALVCAIYELVAFFGDSASLPLHTHTHTHTQTHIH